MSIYCKEPESACAKCRHNRYNPDTGRYECHEAEDVAKRVMARIREQKNAIKKRRAEVSVLLFSWLISTKNFQFSNFLHTFYIKNKEKWRKNMSLTEERRQKLLADLKVCKEQDLERSSIRKILQVCMG